MEQLYCAKAYERHRHRHFVIRNSVTENVVAEAEREHYERGLHNSLNNDISSRLAVEQACFGFSRGITHNVGFRFFHS